MNYDESKPLRTLHQESEKFSISLKKKQVVVNNDELLTGWEDSPPVFMKKSCKKNLMKKENSCKRPKTQTPKNMFYRRIEQRKSSAEEKIFTLEEDKKMSLKELEKIYAGGFISITPKIKNFMFTLNKAKINRMKETFKRNKEILSFEGSIRIQSVSPFSRMNTLNEATGRKSKKSSFSRPYSRIRDIKSGVYKNF